MPTKVGSEFAVNTYTQRMQQNSFATSLTNGNFVVAWHGDAEMDSSSYGIYGQIFTSAGAKSGSEFLINTYTTNAQRYPSVTSLTNGNFVVTWWGEGASDNDGVYGQIFTSAGAKSGSEFLVNTYTTGTQWMNHITSLTNGNFVVTWAGAGASDSDGVYGQIFTSAGAKSGSAFLINTYTTNSQVYPSVTSLTNGNFVVVWSGAGISDSDGVNGQIFTSAGAKSGSEFLINTYTTGSQFEPSVVSLTNGNFVVVWRGVGASDIYDIYGQIFTSAGAKSGSEFLVNTYTTGWQMNPTVTSLTNGNFVVTWAGAGASDSDGVYGQIFTSAGTKSGSDFLINTYTTGTQQGPSITSLTNGDFVVTWDGEGASDVNGIYSQIFHPLAATNTNQAVSYTENISYNLNDIVISGSPTVTITLTLSNLLAGVLSIATAGSVASTYNTSSGVWQASGAVDNVNTLLADLQWVPATNFNGNFTIGVSIQDGGSFTLSDTITMTGLPAVVMVTSTPVTSLAFSSNTVLTLPSTTSTITTLTVGTVTESPSFNSFLSYTTSSTPVSSNSVIASTTPTLTTTAILSSLASSTPSAVASASTLSSSNTALLTLTTLAAASGTLIGDNKPSDNGGGPSIGIIAGAIGGLLGLVGLALLAWYYRKRRSKAGAMEISNQGILPLTELRGLSPSSSIIDTTYATRVPIQASSNNATLSPVYDNIISEHSKNRLEQARELRQQEMQVVPVSGVNLVVSAHPQYDEVVISPLYETATASNTTPTACEVVTFLSATEELDVEQLMDYLKRLTEYGLGAYSPKLFNPADNRITALGTLVDTWLAEEVAKRDDVGPTEIRQQQKKTAKQFNNIGLAIEKLIGFIQMQSHDYAKPSFYASRSVVQTEQQKIQSQITILKALMEQLKAASMKVLADRQSELLPPELPSSSLSLSS